MYALFAKLIFWIVGIIALLVILTALLPGGLLDEVTDNVVSNDLIEEIEYDDNGLQLPMVPQAHQEKITRLKETITKMLTSKEETCFGNYGGFPNLKLTSIQISYDNVEDKTKFTIYGGAGGKQLRRDLSFEIERMRPCVIAGTSSVTNNFEESFLNTKKWEEKNIVSGHYTPASNIEIKYSEDKDDGNVIRVPQFGPKVVNDESNNFQDAGIIYKPTPGSICFFPTVYGDLFGDCDGGDKEGLDNDCLGEDEIEEESIPRQINERKLKLC